MTPSPKKTTKQGDKDKKKDGNNNAKSEKKAKAGGKQQDKQQAKSKKAGKKGQQKKAEKKEEKSASEPESRSVSESESESNVEVEVQALKKVKSKKEKNLKSNEEKKPKKPKRVSFPPSYSAPNMRQPNLLLPPRTSVMQVEHAVEVPDDPRPNAFYDNDSGTMRIYHGPAYGNPSGMLYPKRVYSYQNTPVGVPHPMQNPWYSGFPMVNGQPVPPYVPLPHPPPHIPSPALSAQEGAADENNPWFRGWGTVGPVPMPPNSTATKDKKKQEDWAERHSPSPPPRSYRPKDRDSGWDSNMIPIPSIEVTAPSRSPNTESSGSNKSQGSKFGSSSSREWGAQGASGSKKGTDKQAAKKQKDEKQKDGAIPHKQKSKLVDLGKVLQEVAERDSADLLARGERWSNRSGSSKEHSPQPTNGSGNNDNKEKKFTDWTNATNNNTGDGRNEWNTGNAEAGGGNDWETGNTDTAWDNTATNTGDDTAWDNTATSNNDNSEWAGNDAGNNDLGNNNNNDNNGGGWGNSNGDGNGDGDDWGATVANPPSPPLPGSSTQIPGTWSSPPPSNNSGSSNSSNNSNDSNRLPSNFSADNVGGHASFMASVAGSKGGKGKGKGKGKGMDKGKGKAEEFDPNWGDPTLAQTTGGYWDSKEGQEDLAETGHAPEKNGASWW
jgi:hypothetical protein